MATPVSKQVPDRFLPVMGRVRGAQRPLDPMARLDLVVSTPVRPYDETENLASAVAAAVFNTSQALAAAENVLERLAEAGWVVSAPVISDDGGFMDLIVSLRKRCASAREAEREAAEAGASSDAGWSFGWDETVDAAGDDVAWWGEL
jgi:hypothetical protein